MASMIINPADPLSQSFTIADGSYNGPGGNSTATSLRLYGKGALEWGESVNENLVKLMENFSSATAPLNPINGQAWVENVIYYRNASTNIFYVFSSTAGVWTAINVISSLSQPTAVKGQYWFNTSTQKLHYYHQLFSQYPLSWLPRSYMSGGEAPSASLRPQQQLRVYDASTGAWAPAPVVELSTSVAPPQGNRPGSLRFNPDTNVLSVWTGAVWNSTGGSGSSTPVASYTLPTASSVTLGGVKIGPSLSIDSSGTLDVGSAVVPVATTTAVGGVKVGAGLAVTGDGTLSSTFTVPVASATVLGGVKVGAGLTISSGTLSVSTPTPTLVWSSVGVGAPSAVGANGGPDVSTASDGVLACVITGLPDDLITVTKLGTHTNSTYHHILVGTDPWTVHARYAGSEIVVLFYPESSGPTYIGANISSSVTHVYKM